MTSEAALILLAVKAIREILIAVRAGDRKSRARLRRFAADMAAARLEKAAADRIMHRRRRTP
jgi:hypothetical protein